jgi:hypothetical protein
MAKNQKKVITLATSEIGAIEASFLAGVITQEERNAKIALIEQREASKPAAPEAPKGEVNATHSNAPAETKPETQPSGPNYTQDELTEYLNSIVTGKALDHPAFKQKVSLCNFTDDDRAKIKGARAKHKDICKMGATKAEALALVKKMDMTGKRESANGVAHTLRFQDSKLKEALQEARAKERELQKRGMVKFLITPEEKALLQAQRAINQK